MVKAFTRFRMEIRQIRTLDGIRSINIAKIWDNLILIEYHTGKGNLKVLSYRSLSLYGNEKKGWSETSKETTTTIMIIGGVNRINGTVHPLGSWGYLSSLTSRQDNLITNRKERIQGHRAYLTSEQTLLLNSPRDSHIDERLRMKYERVGTVIVVEANDKEIVING